MVSDPPHTCRTTCRIFRVIGHPSAKSWPELEVMPHWQDNTENVRVPRYEQREGTGLQGTVLEGMRQALPAWACGSIPQVGSCSRCCAR
jgi:cyclin-dependent kinase 8/11